MLLKIKEKIVGFFNPGANSKDHESRINHWIWILIIGCACYLIILDEVFPKAFDKTSLKITIFPFALFFIYEAKFLFKWSRIARIKNDTIKDILVYLAVSASVFLTVWSFGKEAIANNLHLILGYHLMSVVWLIYVYSKKINQINKYDLATSNDGYAFSAPGFRCWFCIAIRFHICPNLTI